MSLVLKVESINAIACLAEMTIDTKKGENWMYVYRFWHHLKKALGVSSTVLTVNSPPLKRCANSPVNPLFPDDMWMRFAFVPSEEHPLVMEGSGSLSKGTISYFSRYFTGDSPSRTASKAIRLCRFHVVQCYNRCVLACLVSFDLVHCTSFQFQMLTGAASTTVPSPNSRQDFGRTQRPLWMTYSTRPVLRYVQLHANGWATWSRQLALVSPIERRAKCKGRIRFGLPWMAALPAGYKTSLPALMG